MLRVQTKSNTATGIEGKITHVVEFNVARN